MKGPAVNDYNFIATGIGSLPHKDAKTAVGLVLRHCPDMPFWPQLPRLSRKEDMLAQFSEGIPCIKEVEPGLLFDEDAFNQSKPLEDFLEELVIHNVDYFKINPSHARGLPEFKERLKQLDLSAVHSLKCHVTGPFTFCAGINDKKGRSILYNEVMRDAVTKALAMKARWQIRQFAEFGKPITVFFDEPFLACFGSAFTPVNKEDVSRVLGEVFEEARKEGASTGIHCCGNTDWSMLLELGSLDIVNFDAFSFFDRFSLYSAQIDSFLERGGAICWGIVPTLDFNDKIKAEELAARLKGYIEALVNKGVNRQRLTRQSLVSPSCGLGSIEEKKAEKILALLSEVPGILRKDLTKAG
ncbi:MAG: hypothetical protein PHR44_02680 [Candidatus Omnitrophica bacterium]|nr:hypothetical protein [Candidatus Omnitrophota bacterium]